MAVLEIPVSNDSSHYSMQIQLEGTVYFLEFYFNTRNERWVFDILDQSETPLLVGQPILTGQLLSYGYTIVGLPAGTFQAIDTTGAGRHPDRDTFGNEVKFVYQESTT